MLKEQRLKREYSGRVWESKNISSRVLSAISIVKKNWEGKEKSSWSGGGEQVRRDLSDGARTLTLKMRPTTAEC